MTPTPSGPYAPHPAGWVDGVDVSIYQRNKVDWTFANTDGHVQFAWIKASESTLWDDAYRFHADAATVQSYGYVKTGAYHFLRNDVDPIKQAEKFASLVPLADELPPMLDVEHAYFDFKNPPPWGQVIELSKRTEAHANACATEVERLTGRRVTVYTGPYYFAHRTDILAAQRPLFVAQYYQGGFSVTSRPKLPLAWPDWTIWQWAGDDGRVEGVEGPCDRNYFQGDRDALDRYISASFLGETREVLPTHDEANTERGVTWGLYRETHRDDFCDDQETFFTECFAFGMQRENV